MIQKMIYLYGMKVNFKKYFDNESSPLLSAIKFFVVILLVFSLGFFVWSIMRYNRIQEEKKDKELYLSQLTEKLDELEYLVDVPIDDEYKIRIARERLGMCFPDEMMYYTDVE